MHFGVLRLIAVFGDKRLPDFAMPQALLPSVETRRSWRVAIAALVVMTFTFGGPWITTVALKDIAAEVGGARSIPSFAAAAAWLCAGIGGIVMGRIAHRVGTRWTIIAGSISIMIGLGISTLGLPWPLWIGHGLFIGLFGLGGINAPLYVYVSRWFDRRRGSALALISSGSFLAGAMWPPIFERAIVYAGWRETMVVFGLVEMCVVVPLAAIVLGKPPEEMPAPLTGKAATAHATRVLGWPPNLIFGAMCAAAILCCMTMSMPQQHLVAFCSDLGYSGTFGALTLSVLLGTAFVSRQVWGAISDRIGGLATVVMSSAWQASAMTALLYSQSQTSLITVSAAFGLGFSGIVPAYVMTLRELYPASEAHWRIPTLLLFTSLGMGGGGWLAGVLYDHFHFYTPAFAAGVLTNLVNLSIVGTLLIRLLMTRRAAIA
jgi:MFS family permease